MNKGKACHATTEDALVNQASKKFKTVYTPTQQVVPPVAQRLSLSAMLASIAFMPNGAPVDAPTMVAEAISRQRRGHELAMQVIHEGYRQELEGQSEEVIAALGKTSAANLEAAREDEVRNVRRNRLEDLSVEVQLREYAGVRPTGKLFDRAVNAAAGQIKGQLLRREGSGPRVYCVQPGLGQASGVVPAVSGPKGAESPHGGPSSRRPLLSPGPIRITDTNSVQKRKRKENEDEPPRKRLGVTLSKEPPCVAADELPVSAADMSEVPDGENVQTTVAAARRKRIPRWRPKIKGINRTWRDDGESPRKRLGITLLTEPLSVAADPLLVSAADMSEVPDGGNIQPTVAAVGRKQIPRWRPKIKGINRTCRDDRSRWHQEPEAVGAPQVPRLGDATSVVLADARRRLSELEAMMALPQMSGQREATFERMELRTLIFSLEKIYT